MKRLVFCFVLLAMGLRSFAQPGPLDFTEASSLTLAGKVFPDTPNPYERMDFGRFGGWTHKDSTLLEMSSGIIVAFRTDSPSIWVKAEFKSLSTSHNSGWAARGFDLYIKRDGRWLWAGAGHYGFHLAGESGRLQVIAEHMDTSPKECILYLPSESRLSSLKIGVQSGSLLEKGEEPFRHRICLHGSSFMHGVCTGRAGQTVPGFLSRATGWQFCSLGVSGDCRMQPQFAAALAQADVDAYVFDAFSNGDAASIKANLFPFIETIQAGRPGVPMIFMSSIWRERRNFDTAADRFEADKRAMADSLMKVAVKRYRDVYYIPSDATSPAHETSVDGIHPGDYGYFLWAESVRKPIVRILRRYGLR